MYEAIARIVAKANKQDFDIKDFKEQRDLMKAVILSCVYGKRTDVEKPKADFLREFGAYLDTKCPKYIEYKKRIQDHIEFRDTVVLDTYFGQPVVVDKGYNPYDDSQMDHKCLNYPIQSCTSLIVIMTVNAILEDFYALGYTEDQIGVYYTRHDEPIFIMDEEVMKDSWIFKDYDKIFIDDWYPMGLEFDFGYSYKETEKSLMDKYDKSVQLNQTKLHYEEMDPPSGEQFYPLPSIYALAVGTAEAFDGSTVIAIYDKANKQCAYLKQENFDFKVVETYMCSIESRFAKAGCQGVLVRNSFVNKEAYYREMSFKYSKGGALDIAAANALAEYMAAKYAKKNSIDVQLSSRCSTYMDVLREVATVETTLPSLAKPDSAQASIRQSILRFYSQRGIEQTREFCQKLLEAENHKDNKDFKAKVHGEICEALLEAILTDYIKKNKLSNRWFFEKGMVIKDLDSRNKDFYTELDLTLFTPGKVVLFECKSYAGEKKLCDECTIVRSCGEFDVYKQNKNHMVVLNTNIKSCCTSNVAGAYKLALFNFSIGGLKDLRDEKRKKIMPVIE